MIIIKGINDIHDKSEMKWNSYLPKCDLKCTS